MRLDCFLVEKEYFLTRTKAKQAIEKGEIYVDGVCITKPSFEILDDSIVERKRVATEFVSVGGYKIEKALNDFDFSVENLVVADIGASTGGFTDCVLQRGAKKVYAVDLNDALLDNRLKSNSKVVQLNANARYIKREHFDDAIDLIVADLSFISATFVMDAFSNILSDGKFLILLIKPQFEIGEKRKFKNGIVNDLNIRKKACLDVVKCAENYGLFAQNITTAPVVEKKNIEYLILFKKNGVKSIDVENFDFIKN